MPTSESMSKFGYYLYLFWCNQRFNVLLDFGFSNILAYCIPEETLIVKMHIKCIKTGSLMLLAAVWVQII